MGSHACPLFSVPSAVQKLAKASLVADNTYTLAGRRRPPCDTMLRFITRRVVGEFVGRRAAYSSAAAPPTGRRRLDGKIALITGGASGLGKAVAHEFIQEGATVVIADIDDHLGSKAAKELGQKAHFFPCNVTVEQEVSDAVDFTVACHGCLDIMHNSAGIVGPSTTIDIASLELAHFDQVMAVNVRGTMAGIKHAARVMGPMSSGSILCTSSISGLLGGLGSYPYSISKFTVIAIMKSAASELCRKGIRVNCISPFAIPTPLVFSQFGQIYPKADTDQIRELIEGLGELKGAMCEDVDIAKAAVFLASDDAKYVSGQNLVVDGAFTCYKHLNLPMPDQEN